MVTANVLFFYLKITLLYFTSLIVDSLTIKVNSTGGENMIRKNHKVIIRSTKNDKKADDVTLYTKSIARGIAVQRAVKFSRKYLKGHRGITITIELNGSKEPLNTLPIWSPRVNVETKNNKKK